MPRSCREFNDQSRCKQALMRVADRCVQVMGGTGVSWYTIVEQVFREIRAFRSYDGPTEVHNWSLARATPNWASPWTSQSK